MYATHHVKTRQSQRGISSSILNYVVDNGFDENDKLIFRRKDALHRLDEIKNEEKILKRIADKGGVVVVTKDNTLITTYSYKSN